MVMSSKVSSPPYTKIKIGSYTGNGTDNRNINIGLNLAAKKNVVIVILPADNGGVCSIRPEMGQGDLTKRFSGESEFDDHIQGLTATGFQIGSANYVNYSAELFRYIVFYK
jgi:hypothetical protein